VVVVVVVVTAPSVLPVASVLAGALDAGALSGGVVPADTPAAPAVNVTQQTAARANALGDDFRMRLELFQQGDPLVERGVGIEQSMNRP